MSKKRNATSISVGGWYLDITDLTLKHVNMGDYWVDAENLDEAKLIGWVRHLSGKSGALSAQDLRDFVKLAQLIQLVDLEKLRRVIQLPEPDGVQYVLGQICARMTRARRLGRKVKTIMKQRGIGPVVSMAVLGKLYEEAERVQTSPAKRMKASA